MRESSLTSPSTYPSPAPAPANRPRPSSPPPPESAAARRLPISLALDRAEHAIGSGIPDSAICESKNAKLAPAFLIVNQQIILLHILQLTTSGVSPCRRMPFSRSLPKNQRLAVLQIKRRVRFGLFRRRIFERAVVEDVAILIDLDKDAHPRAWRPVPSHIPGALHPHPPIRAANVASAPIASEIGRIGKIRHAHRRGFRLLPMLRRRRILPLGQP